MLLMVEMIGDGPRAINTDHVIEMVDLKTGRWELLTSKSHVPYIVDGKTAEKIEEAMNK